MTCALLDTITGLIGDGFTTTGLQSTMQNEFNVSVPDIDID